jgi:hypothetical protein
MLSNVKLSKDFWAETINVACYLFNHSPSTTIECKTPYGAWSSTLANYSNLKTFGCLVIVMLMMVSLSLVQRNVYLLAALMR